ncbi:50S ribosomal protein L18 [Candidatus Woesearchaeota archaeon]|nr:50S ribosomal protein L18 [Candidatus Woesearchaeota archaeon]
MKQRYTLKFRRRTEGKTNYKKRLGILKSGKPRLVIRKSLTNTYIQLIDFEAEGDKVIASGSGFELKKLGWKHNTGNIPAAYLIGLLTGKKIIEKGIKEAVLDIGVQKSVAGNRIYAALKGVTDSGINVPHSEDVMPSEERLKGKHIADYRKIDVAKDFDEIKKKIMGD